MQLNQKQKLLLQDLKSQEEVCIQKYTNYSSMANAGELKNLFNDLLNAEKTHYNTINDILSGKTPQINQSGTSTSSPLISKANYSTIELKNKDEFLCKDALSMEKHVSSVYDTSIFEMADSSVRNALNHIQKEEQQHGEKIFQYMSCNSMCCQWFSRHFGDFDQSVLLFLVYDCILKKQKYVDIVHDLCYYYF